MRTAMVPALPVAPRTSTLWPAVIGTRRRNATQDDMAGFIAAATSTNGTSAGSSTHRRGSTRARSAMVPVSSSATK